MSVLPTPSPCALTQTTNSDVIIPLEEMYDDSIEGLQNKCDKYVSNLRNTVTSLGEIFKDQTIQPQQIKDLLRFPICNLENGRRKLEWVQTKVRGIYGDDIRKEERYFLNTYFKINDLKSWGYRFVDYASASVALAMIFIEATKSQEKEQESSRLTSHWAVTGGFVVLSKALSAVTDYRNKKINEKALKKGRLLDLKYRCDKIYEATAIIDFLKAITLSVEEIDPVALRCQLKKSVRALKDEGMGIVPRSIAKGVKKRLNDLLEKKIFHEAGSVGLLHFQIEKRALKKTFDAWNRSRFSIDSEASVDGDWSSCQVIPLEEAAGVGLHSNLSNEPQEQIDATVVEVGIVPDAMGIVADAIRAGENPEQQQVAPHENQNFSLTAQLQYGTGYSTHSSFSSVAPRSVGFNTPRGQASNMIAAPNLLQLAESNENFNLC